MKALYKFKMKGVKWKKYCTGYILVTQNLNLPQKQYVNES